MSLENLIRHYAKIIENSIDSLNVNIYHNCEQLSFIKKSVISLDSSINDLIKNSIAYEWQIASVVVSILSILITCFTFYHVRRIKVEIRNSNNIDVIRKKLIKLLDILNNPVSNRPIASDLLIHFKNLLKDIPQYKKDYNKNENLKNKIDSILNSESMGKMDVDTSIQEILVDIGDIYAA